MPDVYMIPYIIIKVDSKNLMWAKYAVRTIFTGFYYDTELAGVSLKGIVNKKKCGVSADTANAMKKLSGDETEGMIMRLPFLFTIVFYHTRTENVMLFL